MEARNPENLRNEFTMKVHAFFQRAGVLLAVLLITVACVLPVHARAVYSGGLGEVLEEAEPDSFIPLLVLFNKPLHASEVRLEIQGMSLPERREHVVGRLKEHLVEVALRPINWMENEYMEGRADHLEPLWLANGYVLQLRADRVERLAEFREIQTLHFDRPVSFDESNDEAPWTDPGDVPMDDIGWGVETIGTLALWDQGYRGRGALVAVIDTGMDLDHPDLENQLWTNVDEIPGNNMDDDNNGYIDDVHGWNFYDDNNNLMDVQGHGTKCAGVLVGNGTNGDTTGIAPEAELMVIRNYDSNWSSEATHLLAVQYALNNGASVISCSMSYEHNPDAMDVSHRTVQEFALLGGLIQANSMGNNGDGNEPYNINAPARCPHPWLPPEQTLVGGTAAMISVGAHNTSGTVWYYSTEGPTEWDNEAFPDNYCDYPYDDGASLGLLKPTIVAPASTPTTSWTGGYTTFTGESSSTPHVGGALILLRSIHPQATPEDLTEAIINSAEDGGDPGFDNLYGAGRLRVDLAHEYLDNMFDYASLTATITDTNGVTIPNAKVVLGSSEIIVYSNDDGAAVMERVQPGEYDIYVIADDYNPGIEADVQFTGGDDVEMTIELEPSTPGGGVQILPDEIIETIEVDDVLEQTFVITNLFDHSIQVLPRLKTQDETDWELDRSITINQDILPMALAVRDCTVFLWGYREPDSYRIWELDLDGFVQDSLDLAEEFHEQRRYDLAFDGESGYFAARGDTIYHFNEEWAIDSTLGVNVPNDQIFSLAFDPILNRYFLGVTDSVLMIMDSLGQETGMYVLAEDANVMVFNPDDEQGASVYYQSADDVDVTTLLRVRLSDGVLDTLTTLHETVQGRLVGLLLDRSTDSPFWSVGAFFDQAPLYMYRRELDYTCYSIEDTVVVYSLESEQVGFDLVGNRFREGSRYDLLLEWADLYGEWVIETPLTIDVIQYVEDGPEDTPLPYTTELMPPFPNPFNSQVQLSYRLGETAEVSLAVYNVLGQKVSQLVQGRKPAGQYEATWIGDGMATGVYVAVLHVGKERYAVKMTLIR